MVAYHFNCEQPKVEGFGHLLFEGTLLLTGDEIVEHVSKEIGGVCKVVIFTYQRLSKSEWKAIKSK